MNILIIDRNEHKAMTNEIRFILYQLPEEEGKVQVVIKDETIWATQKAMAQLFGVGVPAISKHLKNIFDEKELDEQVIVSKMEITTPNFSYRDFLGNTPISKQNQATKRRITDFSLFLQLQN